jgi:pimeloyl-ACP methyl ester carboxylesterase
MLIREPVEIRVTFEAGALRWQEEGQAARRARRLELREEEIRFSNGEVELTGTLIRPLGKGPFPAIVLTQTSNDAPRDAYRKEAGFFATKGFAAFVYDKRGVGRSTGDWRRATMLDLAEDASAAVERLGKTEGINPARIGIWGQSQGGWIGPLAASLNPRIAFVIAQSAPTVTPAEQEIFRVEHNLRADEFPPEQIEDAVRYQKLLMRWVLEGAGRDELSVAAREAEKSPWAEYVALPADPLPDRPREATRLFYGYDPRPALRALRCPVLFLFGDRDSFVPVERSLEELQAILAEPGHRDQTIQVLRNTAHGMWETRFDGRKHFQKARRYGDRYWQKLAAWLEARKR